MECFLIFDSEFDPDQLIKYFKQPTVVHLFPLTSNFIVIERIVKRLKTNPMLNVKLIASATSINDEANKMQKSIIKWSHQLANHPIGGKNLKEWFLLPDGSGTSWWYSILSEKNAVQETVYFKLAQINAIKKQLAAKPYDRCFISTSDKRMKRIIQHTAKNLQINPIPILSLTDKSTVKQKIFTMIHEQGILGAFLAAFLNWFVWFKNSRAARKALPPQSKRGTPHPFLFISYFPNIDNEAAKVGKFRNKYALALQDKFHEIQQPISWLLMPVYYNGHDYQSSLGLARRFIENGEQIYVLQEFFKPKLYLQAIWWWLRQAVLGIYLYTRINKQHLTGNLTIPEALPIIKYLWLHSFVGTSSVRGILFHLSFKELFYTMPHVKTCLYYCEMQAWEKALIHAKKQVNPKVNTMAFQHTVVGRNYYNYFYHPGDTKQHGTVLDFPLPDRLIANGKRMYEFLAESEYAGLCQAEAIRQLYLNNIQQSPRCATDKPVLLVGGSCDKVEMKSLLTMLHAAFPKPCDFDLWIKASPVMPCEPLFDELGIDIKQAGYQVLHTDVSELIKSATVALIANTTVSIEAAANGCPVIVPVFADTLLMNPIIGTNAKYYQVMTVQELKMTVEKLLQSSHEDAHHISATFIKEYWNINPDIPLWTNLISQNLYAT